MKHITICAIVACFTFFYAAFQQRYWHKEHRLHLKIYLFTKISLLAFTHPQLILLISRLDRTAPGGSYATTGTLGADRVLVANSTAATNSGIFT
jgi:glucose-6-phosphate-specific signal transduction histidine kinase